MDAHDTEGTDGHFELTQGAADHLRGFRDRASVLQAIDLYAWRRFEKRVERWRLADCKREERADGGSYKRTRPDAATFYLENKRAKPNDVPFYLENMDRDPCEVSDEFMDTISGDQLGLGGVPFPGDLEQWSASFGDLKWPEGWAGPQLTQACLFRMTPHEKIFADATSTKIRVGAQVEYSLKAQILMHMHGQYKSTGGRGSRHRVPDPNVPEHDVWTDVIPYPMGYVSPFTNAPWLQNTVTEALMPLISEAYRAGLMTAAGGFPDIVATAAALPSLAVQQAAAASAEAHITALQQLAQQAATPQVTTPSGETIAVAMPTEDPIPQIDNWEERSREMARAPSVDLAWAFRTDIVVPVSEQNPRLSLDMYRAGSLLSTVEIGTISTEEFRCLGGISDGGLLHRTDNLWRARGLDYRHFMRQRVPSRAVGDARALLQYPAERAVSLDALVTTHNSRHFHLAREDGTRRLIPHLGQNEAYWTVRPMINDDSRRRLEIGLGQAPLTNFDMFLRDLIERPRYIKEMRQQAIENKLSYVHGRNIDTWFPEFVSRIGTTHELLLPRMHIMNTLVTIVTKGRPGGRWTGIQDFDHVNQEAKQGWIVLPYSPENGITLPAYDVFVRHIVKYRGPSREYEGPVFSNGLQLAGATNAQYRELVVLGHVNNKLLAGTFTRQDRAEYEQGFPANLFANWDALWTRFTRFWRGGDGEDGGPARMMGRAAINSETGNGMAASYPHEPFQEGAVPSERRWFNVWGNPRRLSAQRKAEFAGAPLPSHHGMEMAIAEGSSEARAIASNAQAPDGLRFSMRERFFNDTAEFATLVHPDDVDRITTPPPEGGSAPTEVRVSARRLSALFLQEQLRRPTQDTGPGGYMRPWPSMSTAYKNQCGPLLVALHRPLADQAQRSQFENYSNPARWEPVSYSDPWFVEDPVSPADRNVPASLDANRKHVYKSGVLLQLCDASSHRGHATRCLERLANDANRQLQEAQRMDGERRRPPRPVEDDFTMMDARDPDHPGHGRPPTPSDSSGDEDNSESEDSDAEEHHRPFEARAARR